MQLLLVRCLSVTLDNNQTKTLNGELTNYKLHNKVFIDHEKFFFSFLGLCN